MRISIRDARLSEALTKSDMLAQPGSRARYFSSIVGLPVTEQRAGYRPDRANDSHTSVLNTAAIFGGAPLHGASGMSKRVSVLTMRLIRLHIVRSSPFLGVDDAQNGISSVSLHPGTCDRARPAEEQPAAVNRSPVTFPSMGAVCRDPNLPSLHSGRHDFRVLGAAALRAHSDGTDRAHLNKLPPTQRRDGTWGVFALVRGKRRWDVRANG